MVTSDAGEGRGFFLVKPIEHYESGVVVSIKVQRRASLQQHNTLAVPAIASHLVEVHSLSEVTEAIQFARQRDLAILVLGEGSNTVFANDYEGLVVLNRLRGIDVVSDDDDSVTVKVGGGENWHQFVDYAVEQGWFGLENLALIPGLVGAAPIQNIGAYGVEVKDTLLAVEFVEFATAELTHIKNQSCQFAYRDSIFKHSLKGKGIICSVVFRLSKKPKLRLSYPALETCFSGQAHVTPRQVFDAVCSIRNAKLPLPAEIPNVGSFFKNPVVDDKAYRALKRSYPELVSYPAKGLHKLAAGWLIEYAGWKTRAIDGVSVHQNQALVIVNPQQQSGQSVIKYARAIQQDIREKFGVDIQIEPQIY